MHGKVWGVITYPFPSQTSTVAPLKFGNALIGKFHPTLYTGRDYSSMQEVK